MSIRARIRGTEVNALKKKMHMLHFVVIALNGTHYRDVSVFIRCSKSIGASYLCSCPLTKSPGIRNELQNTLNVDLLKVFYFDENGLSQLLVLDDFSTF